MNADINTIIIFTNELIVFPGNSLFSSIYRLDFSFSSCTRISIATTALMAIAKAFKINAFRCFFGERGAEVTPSDLSATLHGNAIFGKNIKNTLV